VATLVLRNRLNIAKYLTDYQKSKHFSNAVKDSSAGVTNLYVTESYFLGTD